MTKQEYIASQQRQTRAINRRLGIWMVVLSVGIMAMIPLGDYIEEKEFDEPWVKNASGFILLGLLASVALLAWYAIRLQNRHSYHCPHCQKPLIGLAANIAIASGNCGECGANVFTGPNDDE